VSASLHHQLSVQATLKRLEHSYGLGPVFADQAKLVRDLRDDMTHVNEADRSIPDAVLRSEVLHQVTSSGVLVVPHRRKHNRISAMVKIQCTSRLREWDEKLSEWTPTAGTRSSTDIGLT